MTFAPNTSINPDATLERFYGAPRPVSPQGENNPGAAVVAQEQRLTGVSWSKDEKGEVKIEQLDDRVALTSTNIMLSESPSRPLLVSALGYAQEKLDEFRGRLYAKLLEAYEEAYKNTFHHNRLVANVAEWTIDKIFGKLTALGISQKEIDEIRVAIKSQLIDENYMKMCETVYNRALDKVVG